MKPLSGVNFNKKQNKWRVSININGNRKHFGSFNTLGEANDVRNELNKQYNYVNEMPCFLNLTQKSLKQIVLYNPKTGIFKWRITYTGVISKGNIIGKQVINTTSGKKYRHLVIDDKRFSLHRLAFLYMTDEIPDIVDHINGDGTDNRWCNLREASYQLNNQNARLNKRNKSGVLGVRWDKSRNKWFVSISINSKGTSLGRFTDFFEACCVRKSAEKMLGYHKNHGSTRPL